MTSDRDQSQAKAQPIGETDGYRSPFGRSPSGSWHGAASVRATLDQGASCDVAGDWFSEHPGISDHPLVVAAGRRDAVLAALLIAYLEFTVRLELTAIVAATRDLAMRRVGADYDAAVVRDALRVQCDEAFHALLCEELAEHAARVTGIERGGFPEHHFFGRVRELQARAEGTLDAAQFGFCVAVIAETVITDSLFKDRRDTALRPEVREVLTQHYKDEIRHTIFFSEALKIIFPQWSAAAQQRMTTIWPELVVAFLRIDEHIVATALARAGLSDDATRQILADGVATRGALAARHASVQSTLRALRRVGVLPHGDSRSFADRLAMTEAMTEAVTR